MHCRGWPSFATGLNSRNWINALNRQWFFRRGGTNSGLTRSVLRSAASTTVVSKKLHSIACQQSHGPCCGEFVACFMNEGSRANTGRTRLSGDRRLRCEVVICQRGRECFFRVETAISVFSGPDAQIGNADYPLIGPPAAGLADYAKPSIMESNRPERAPNAGCWRQARIPTFT